MWSSATGFFPKEKVSRGHSCCSLYECFISTCGGIIVHCGESAFYLSVHQLMDRFPLLGFSNAATNMRVHVSISLGWLSRSGAAGSDGITMFNILRKVEIVFQSDYNILRSHQQSPDPWSWEVFLPT